jgi:hypothetical protein
MSDTLQSISLQMKGLALTCDKISTKTPGNLKVWLGKADDDTNIMVSIFEIRAFVDGYKRLLEIVLKEEETEDLLVGYPVPEQKLIKEIMEDNPGISIKEAIAIMEDAE